MTVHDDDDDDDDMDIGGGQFSEVGSGLSKLIIWRRPFCGFLACSRSIPYFEFSPQMGRMICANIAERQLGLPCCTSDFGRWSNRWHHMLTHRVDRGDLNYK